MTFFAFILTAIGTVVALDGINQRRRPYWFHWFALVVLVSFAFLVISAAMEPPIQYPEALDRQRWFQAAGVQ